jgi:hypothetical protein
MKLSNVSVYDRLYEDHKKEFAVGKKTFSQIRDWISQNYDFIEVPLHLIPQIHIDVFMKNCENITRKHIVSSDGVRAYKLLERRGNGSLFHGIDPTKNCWSVIEESTCYMESNCVFFDVEYYINLGIEEYNISKYTDELIIYLNYFNMRDVLLGRE